MVSLFDYLNKPAGSKLGQKVNKYAIFTNQPVVTKRVETKNYNGLVFMYNKEFLDEFFKLETYFNSTGFTEYYQLFKD